MSQWPVTEWDEFYRAFLIANLDGRTLATIGSYYCSGKWWW